MRTPGLTIESVWERPKVAARAGPVFSKDFLHYIDHMCTREFLGHFTHSFLVRDPAKTIASMFKHWPDFHLKETGFIEQRRLFDRLNDEFGEMPPVLDSDDLLEDPGRMVKAWCDAVGIPFIP